MKRVIFFILFLQLVLNCANIKTYTIAVCTTLDFDGAMNCKRKILKDNKNNQIGHIKNFVNF